MRLQIGESLDCDDFKKTFIETPVFSACQGRDGPMLLQKVVNQLPQQYTSGAGGVADRIEFMLISKPLNGAKGRVSRVHHDASIMP